METPKRLTDVTRRLYQPSVVDVPHAPHGHRQRRKDVDRRQAFLHLAIGRREGDALRRQFLEDGNALWLASFCWRRQGAL